MSSRSSKPISIPGRIIGTVFFLLFLAAGLVLTTVITRQVMAGESARNWPSVHGSLTRAQIAIDENSNKPFTVVGSYDYTVLGESYSGSRIRLDEPVFDSYRKAHLLMRKIVDAQPLKVYYNPDTPGESILLHSSRWGFLFILFPLIFVLIGLGGIIGIWIRNGCNRRKFLKRVGVEYLAFLKRVEVGGG